MAVFAILFFPYLWSLVVSQEACAAEKCGFKGASNGVSTDVASMVQLNVRQSSSITLVDNYELAAEDQSCDQFCAPGNCDVDKIRMVNDYDLQFLAVENGGTCVGNFQNGNSPGNPSIALQTSGTTCWRNAVDPSKQATCEAPPANSVDRRVCYCIPTVGGGQGDPHIHSLWGARYTLLQQGVFIAWNFTKAVPASALPGAAPARGWQLLAAYAGDHFTTQGLLLLDRSGQSMEITAKDCAWRVQEKKSPWRKAQVELLLAEDGTTSLQVKKLHEKLGETKMLRSAILLKMMDSGSKMKKIANLVVHCRPNDHLDFKMAMFQKKDIKHVGGELGVAPDENHNYHFLFSKQGMMRMRADQEFKAPESWVTLGGSPAGSAYLEKKHQAGTGFLETQSCGDDQKKSATAICAKHLQETRHPQMFAECVYDICQGGDESFAETAAAFLLPLEESST